MQRVVVGVIGDGGDRRWWGDRGGGETWQKENAPPVASREGWCIVLFMFNRRRLEFYCFVISISVLKSLVSEVSTLVEFGSINS